MKKSTDELSKILESKKTGRELDEFLKENRENFSEQIFTEMLEQTLKENKVRKSQAIRRSLIDRTYAYNIFQGVRVPSRDKLIMLCIGMGADCEQTKRLLLKLKLAPLYTKDARDSIILFGLLHKLSVIDINALLYEKNFQILQ